MRLFEHLQQTIGFTRKEALAVLVLSATFLGGIGIRWFQSNQPKPPQKQFDYTQSDSTYYSRGKQPAPAPSAPLQPTPSTQKPSRKNTQTININSAGKSQLMDLPGIGPSYADRIIEYRKTRGTFTSIEELANVKGIGKKKLEKLRPFILVR